MGCCWIQDLVLSRGLSETLLQRRLLLLFLLVVVATFLLVSALLIAAFLVVPAFFVAALLIVLFASCFLLLAHLVELVAKAGLLFVEHAQGKVVLDLRRGRRGELRCRLLRLRGARAEEVIGRRFMLLRCGQLVVR